MYSILDNPSFHKVSANLTSTWLDFTNLSDLNIKPQYSLRLCKNVYC